MSIKRKHNVWTNNTSISGLYLLINTAELLFYNQVTPHDRIRQGLKLEPPQGASQGFVMGGVTAIAGGGA